MSVAEIAVPDAFVRLEGVRKSFGDNLVLDGIDLDVALGEVCVIIGPSGSGKSTLLRCVNLLEPIQAGRIFLEGFEITGRRDVSATRQRIGIVFQQFNLFPHLRVIDNLTLAARRIKKMPRARAEERAHELLARAPSTLLSATLDDAVGERRRPNMPGTTDRSNWSLPLPVLVEDLAEHPLLQTVARTLATGVGAG